MPHHPRCHSCDPNQANLAQFDEVEKLAQLLDAAWHRFPIWLTPVTVYPESTDLQVDLD